MSVLPIVSRELRVAARKPATYWNRVGVGLAAILVAMFALVSFQRALPGQTGIMLFVAMSIIAFLHCLLMGFVLTADSISEEKRDGTLGLLFLTDLKGYDVVFGKLVATSLRGVFGLLAIFPIMGLCFLLGGVTGIEFARVMLVCLNILLLSLATGILASALCRDERKALAWSALILLLLTGGAPAIAGWIQATTGWRDHRMEILVFSPGYAAFHSFASTYNPERFWTAVTLQHVLAWLALGAACVIVPRTWQQKAASAGELKRASLARRLFVGSDNIRAEFRRRLLDINAYYWLTARHRLKALLPWVWLSAAGLVWLIGLIKDPNDWRDSGVYITTAFALHSLFKVWMALEASRQIGQDRQSGALELLLCTPFPVSGIITGQWLALLRQFLGPVVAVLFVDFLFMLGGMPNSNQGEWIGVWVVGMSVFVLDLAALGWLGMWRGLMTRRTSQGGVNALFSICGLPWILFLGFIATLAVMDELRIVRINKVDDYFLFIWWLISVAVAVSFLLYARKRLLLDLRLTAAERYLSAGARLGRALGLLYGRRKAETSVPPRTRPI